VVLVSHRPGAVALADRLLLLANGEVQAEGPRDAVLAAIRAAASAKSNSTERP
jgi:ATP-binding cassette subfamily C exporter for protease/lipase